jgi:hypothetical protein
MTGIADGGIVELSGVLSGVSKTSFFKFRRVDAVISLLIASARISTVVQVSGGKFVNHAL